MVSRGTRRPLRCGCAFEHGSSGASLFSDSLGYWGVLARSRLVTKMMSCQNPNVVRDDREVLGAHASRVVRTTAYLSTVGEGAVLLFPGDSSGGGEPTIDAYLRDPGLVGGAEPEGDALRFGRRALRTVRPSAP